MILTKPVKLLAPVLLCAGLGFVQPANAVTQTCADPVGDGGSTLSIEDYVIGVSSGTNSGCEIGTVNDSTGTQVNSDTMFDESTWVFDSDTDDLGTPLDPDTLQLVLAGDDKSGDWSIINTAWTTYDSILLTFADGNGTPDSYVGYLLTIDDGTSGTYTSPFLNANGKVKAIGEISAYVYIGDELSSVPLPAALPMFLASLVGLFWVGRRRRGVAGAA